MRLSRDAHTLVFSLSLVLALAGPCAQALAQAPPAPRAQGPAPTAQPDPDIQPDPTFTAETFIGMGAMAGSLLVSPLMLQGMHSDIAYGEGLLISTASALGAVSLGAGVGALFLAYVLFDDVYESVMGLMEIPIINIIIGIPLLIIVTVMGAALIGGGAALTLGSPVILGFGMAGADRLIGEGPDNLVTLTVATTLTTAMGLSSYVLWTEVFEFDEEIAVGLSVGTSILLTTFSYGLFRDVEDNQTTMIATPLIHF